MNNCRVLLADDEAILSSGIPIPSSISRLKLYYQENAEVIYMRNETGGTTVKIKIKTASEET